jgi:hypothetical protein
LSRLFEHCDLESDSFLFVEMRSDLKDSSQSHLSQSLGIDLLTTSTPIRSFAHHTLRELLCQLGEAEADSDSESSEFGDGTNSETSWGWHDAAKKSAAEKGYQSALLKSFAVGLATRLDYALPFDARRERVKELLSDPENVEFWDNYQNCHGSMAGELDNNNPEKFAVAPIPEDEKIWYVSLKLSLFEMSVIFEELRPDLLDTGSALPTRSSRCIISCASGTYIPLTSDTPPHGNSRLTFSFSSRPGVHEGAGFAAQALGIQGLVPEYPFNGTWFKQYLVAISQATPHKGRPNVYAYWIRSQNGTGPADIHNIRNLGRFRRSPDYPEYEEDWVETVFASVDAADVWDVWTLLRMIQCESASREITPPEHNLLRAAQNQAVRENVPRTWMRR